MTDLNEGSLSEILADTYSVSSKPTHVRISAAGFERMKELLAEYPEFRKQFLARNPEFEGLL